MKVVRTRVSTCEKCGKENHDSGSAHDVPEGWSVMAVSQRNNGEGWSSVDYPIKGKREHLLCSFCVSNLKVWLGL